MEVVEKQVEKIKEVPYGYWENCGNGCGPYPYNRGFNNWGGSTPFASKGVAGTGLGLR